jgi:hypothetical protein
VAAVARALWGRGELVGQGHGGRSSARWHGTDGAAGSCGDGGAQGGGGAPVDGTG